MSGVQDGAAAYSRLQVPEDSLNQGLQYWAGMSRKNTEDELARRERGNAAKEKAKKEADERLEKGFEFSYVPVHTQIRGVDDNNTEVTKATADRIYELHKQALELKQQGKYNEAEALLLRKSKVENNLKLFTRGNENFKAFVDDFQKKVSEGKVDPQDQETYISMIDAVQNNQVYTRYDENDNLVNYVMIPDPDNPEKGSVEKIYTGDLVNMNLKWRPKVNIQEKGGFIEQVQGMLGTHTEDKVSGQWVTTTQSWDDTREKAARQQIDAFLGNKDTQGSVVFSLLGKKVKLGEAPAPEDLNAAKEALYKMIRGTYDTGSSKEYNRPPSSDDGAGKGKTKEPDAASARKFDLDSIINNNDVTPLNGGKDITYQGWTGQAKNPRVLGNKIAFDFTYLKGKNKKPTSTVIYVDKSPSVLNAILDQMQGKVVPFDKVQLAEPQAYRELGPEGKMDLHKELGNLYNPDGTPTEDLNDDDVYDKLKLLFPDVPMSIPFSMSNVIAIRGKDIDLDRPLPQVVADVKAAIWPQGNEARPSMARRVVNKAKSVFSKSKKKDPAGILN